MTSPPRAYSYIRMSTDLQLRGDSLRRQLDASRSYAAENGFELIDDDRLQDIGISAFKGANVEGGALGRFLEAVKAEKVPRGSYLLVESLDRLSRQALRKSLTLFLNIINAGINIVTLADKRLYTEDKCELEDLLTSLVVMSRAHEEFLTKSHRISAAWANKRSKAETQPLTAMCPAWLRLSKDRKRYEVIEKRAAVIRRIFAESASGIGNYSITHRLNTQRVPHFGKSNGWHMSYVSKILKNRSVTGEFQPHKRVNGKRRPDGDPIPNYFPTVVDSEMFYRVQAALVSRLNHGAGRKGETISNLFSNVAKCAYCGSPVKFENKGKPPKGATFLVCDGAKRGLGCEIARWRYDEFEASFLAFVQELDFSEVIETDNDIQRAALDNTIAGLRGELTYIETQRDKTFALLQKVDAASAYVATKLNELESRRREVEKQLDDKAVELSSLQARTKSVQESEQDFKKLMAALKGATGDELYKLRAQIAQQIRLVCTGLYVAPLGPTSDVEIAEIKGTDTSAIATLKKEVNAEAAGRRFFAVEFEKSLRIVFPADDDPARLDMMRYIGPSPGLAITLVLAPRAREGR